MDGDFEATELDSFLKQQEMYALMEAADNAHTAFSFDDWSAVRYPEVPRELHTSDRFITSFYADSPPIPSFSPQQPEIGSKSKETVQEQQQFLQQNQQKHGNQQQQEEEVEGEGEGDAKRQNGNEGTSRNLVFERKRRKRLNQQLLTLRSLVPNITKMDKRSILIDALAYLKNVLQQINKEMEKPSLLKSSSAAAASSVEDSSAIVVEASQLEVNTKEYDCFACLPAITKIEGDILNDQKFILKICCNKVVGAVGLVQRAIEMVGLQITCVSVDQCDNATMLTTAFLHSKKKGVFTLEKLLKKVRTNAAELGLSL